MLQKYLIGLTLFSLLMLFLNSQNSSQNFIQILKTYQEVDGIYQHALKINPVTQKDEALEDKLNKTALQQFLQIEKGIPEQNRAFDSLHFFLSLRIGELAHYYDSLPMALHYYQQAISLKKQLPELADSFAFKPYLFSGHIYFYRNQLDSAQFNFKQAEKIQDKCNQKIKESERLYNDLGVLYFQAGNYKEASNYFQKATQLLDNSNPYYRNFYVNYNINTAIAYFKLDDNNKAEQILKELLPYREHLNEIYNNLGLVEQQQGMFKTAIDWFQKVHYQSALDIGLENDKASSWLSLGQIDSARKCLQTALLMHVKYNGPYRTSIDHGLTFKISGDLEMKEKNYSLSLSLYQKALNQFYPSFSDTSIYANPKEFSGFFSYIHLFHTLVAKAQAFDTLYQSSHNILWAREELKSYEASLSLIDYIERVYQSDEARLFLAKSRYLIRDQPIDIAFELYKQTKDNSFLEKAYEMDQRNKASVLAYNEERNQLLPPSSKLRSREQALKEDITRLSLSFANVADKDNISTINGKIRDLEIQLNKVQETISETSPSIEIAIPRIKDLQDHLLDPSTMLVSYHLGAKKLTVFSITRSKYRAFQRDLYSEFQNDLKSFIYQLNLSSDVLPSDTIQKKLSSVLLKDIITNDYNRLIIIPDEQLNYLSFEALPYNGAYLINHCSIQYQYSTSLLKTETTNFKKAKVVSFAPFTSQGYEDSTLHLEPLPYSKEEISQLPGNSFSGNQASKRNFLEKIHGSEVIHLATHASASDSEGIPSYIVFAPWKQPTRNDFLLFSPEIYNLSMQDQKLIILSACETGHGKLVPGEGVMSLTRAFAYAGCPDIITSLWKADDEATAYITQKMHNYLQEGYPIDRALQVAKINYLSDRSIHPRRKQPAYWSHLVFIGNYQPIYKNHTWLITLILVVMAALLALIFWKKAKARKIKNNNRNT